MLETRLKSASQIAHTSCSSTNDGEHEFRRVPTTNPMNKQTRAGLRQRMGEAKIEQGPSSIASVRNSTRPNPTDEDRGQVCWNSNPTSRFQCGGGTGKHAHRMGGSMWTFDNVDGAPLRRGPLNPHPQHPHTHHSHTTFTPHPPTDQRPLPTNRHSQLAAHAPLPTTHPCPNPQPNPRLHPPPHPDRNCRATAGGNHKRGGVVLDGPKQDAFFAPPVDEEKGHHRLMPHQSCQEAQAIPWRCQPAALQNMSRKREFSCSTPMVWTSDGVGRQTCAE